MDYIQLIKALIDLGLKTDVHESIVKHVGSILNDLSREKTCLIVIFDNNGIQFVYTCLQSSIDYLIIFGINILHNMIRYLKEASIVIRKTGGIYHILKLIHKNNNRLQAIIVDCLRRLAYGSPEGKEILFEYRGFYDLIRIFSETKYEKLLWNIARCIKVLSCCLKNRQSMVNAGVIQCLSSYLTHSSRRLVMNCLWAIRNLSDLAFSQQNLGDLINKLVCILNNLLETDHLQMISCIVCILANLTYNNPFYKDALFQFNGLPVLIQILIKVDNCKTIIETTLITLRHLTSKHYKASCCRAMIRLNCSMPLIIRYLYPPFKWSTINEAIQLIRNLTIDLDNQKVLRELNLIERHLQLLSILNEESKHAYYLNKNINDCVLDGINVQQIIENILYTFQILETDQLNCQVLINLNFVSLCHDMISYQTESIINIVHNCLNHLNQKN